MATLIHYMCKYCGNRQTCPSTKIPLRTKCLKAPSGLHVWVKVD